MPAPPLPHARVLRIVLGLLPAMFLAAIDQTLVSVALLTIGRDLKDFALIPWVIAGSLVASTVATPIYGKLSDSRGRRPLLLFAIGLYVGSAVLCSVAQSMPQLVVFRILQGLGAGGLLSLVQAVVADIAPGPERGRYQGYLAGTFAVAAVAGPMLGGLLTHHISWRAVFWMSVPLGGLAWWLAHRALRSIAFEPKPHRIDYAGAALLGGAISSAMVALTLMGQGRPLLSTVILGLFGLAAALTVVLVLQERQAPEPLLPPELFRNAVVVTCCAVLSLQFFVMVGSTVMLPLALQSLGRADANEVALRMLPLTLATPAGAFTAGRIMYLTAHYRPSVLAGATLTLLASAGLAWLGTEATWSTAGLMAVLGYGLGLTMPTLLVAAQTAAPKGLIGVVTSTTALFRTLGGAVGIAIMSSILFVQLRPEPAGGQPSTTPAGATRLAQPVLDALVGAPAPVLREAFLLVFATAALAAAGALLLAATLPARRLARPLAESPSADS